ncbi:MAG: triose-phosphate isomerase [Deltaproteobacteria bacterium]|nr:triose-phosphate isomerase [Deltaproteobacteria bacterium]
MDPEVEGKRPLRTPVALANWKMGMTIGEGVEFIEYLREHLPGKLLEEVDVILFPPYTSLHPLASALKGWRVALGSQDLCPKPGESQTRKE